AGSQQVIHLPALAQELRIYRKTRHEASLGLRLWPDGIVETGKAHAPGRLVQRSKRFNQPPGSVGSQRSIARMQIISHALHMQLHTQDTFHPDIDGQRTLLIPRVRLPETGISYEP